MQDYTPLGSTATTTVKDCMLNHEKNINALRSNYSGTTFPTSNLVEGMKCYRTDLGKTYTYNGKAWTDAVSTSSLTVSGETSVPTPATTNNSKTIANTEFVHGVVNNLVNGAPTALDTLQELATALGNDPNFSTTVLNKIGEKESKTDAQIEYKKLQDAIPTKVSQLTNDSGYATKADVEAGGSNITVDDTLSDTSTNPVQNKIINAALGTRAGLYQTFGGIVIGAHDEETNQYAGFLYGLPDGEGDPYPAFMSTDKTVLLATEDYVKSAIAAIADYDDTKF